MQNLTDVDAFTTVQAIADGDALDGTNHATAGQGAANRTRFLQKRVMGAEASDPIRFPLIALPQATVRWEGALYSGTGAICLSQNNVGTAWGVWFELDIPKYAILDALAATIVGTAGHAGVIGTLTKPIFTLFSQDPGSAAAPTLVATVTDPSADFAAYELPHPLSLPALNETLIHDGGLRYYAYLTGEAGANSVTGLGLLSISGFISPI